jgi:hypothetical protein
MRSLKIALFAFVWLAAFTSCATAKRCAKKFPPPPADTITTVLTQWRDTTIYVTLPADTLRDSIFIDLPCPPAEHYTSGVVSVENDMAAAKAWVENKRLQLQLELKHRRLEIYIDSVAATRTKTVTITKTEVVKQKYVPVFYKASVFVNGLLVALFIIGIYLSLRR